jgi:ATP-dependent Clp protease adaptor protein ClpS
MKSVIVEDFSVDELINSIAGKQLIVHNDDVNSFDWVINSFIEVLHHSHIQAEQCAMIIHHKGKCSVKDGSYEELEPYKDTLGNRGLSVTIE